MSVVITDSAEKELKKIIEQKPQEAKAIRINVAGYG